MDSSVNPAEHVGLVYTTAHRYAGNGVDFDDLVQEGSFGLMRAAETFDPARGKAFSTHAVWCIRSVLSKLVRDARRRRVLAPFDSLDAPIKRTRGEGEAALSLLDLLEDEQPRADEQLEDAERRTVVRQAVAELSAKQRNLLRMRFAWGLSLEQIGEQLGGLSHQAVMRMLRRVFKVLRPRLERIR